MLDYDDLLLYWAEMLKDKELAEEIGGRFDHVLVDEYQDTNRLQAKILLRLKPDGRGVMVVGDDAQSIYSFRAATVRNILDFPAGLSLQLASSRSNKTTGPRSLSCIPATWSWVLRRNASRKTCGQNVNPNKSPT